MLMLIVIWLMLMGFSDNQDEPAYKGILYGGMWKQVVVNPSRKYTEVQNVEEKLLKHFHNSELFLGSRIENMGCYISINLLYSLSDTEPLLVTREFVSSDGSMYSVSIPIPLGSTYFCEMKTQQEQDFYYHYITVTKLIEEHPIYIYSHTFSSFESGNSDLKLLTSSNEECHCGVNSSNIVLSSLIKTKDLFSIPCYVKKHISKAWPYQRTSDWFDEPNNKSDKHPSVQVNVMTFNVWNFNPYHDDKLYFARKKRLTQLVASAKPDIIGLQEVRLDALRGGILGPSQMDHLVPHLKPFQYVFQPAQVFDGSLQYGRVEEGVAILSKFPIIYHDYLLLFRNKSNSADGHQRICLHAVISVPKIGLVHVFNTHYSLSHEARLEASRQILEFMSLHEGPAFLLGDLNAAPEEEAIKMLLKKDDTNLVDLWTELHPKDLGYTFNTLEKTLSKRIDYILMRKSLRVKPSKIEVLKDNTRSNICSDHRAVQATISFKACN